MPATLLGLPGWMDSATEISNLLYRYAECIDSGDFEGAAALFEHAQIRLAGDRQIAGPGLLGVWRRSVTVHPDGTPRTKHLITNPILEIDETGDAATCRSYYTVLQATPALPLQIVASGRYHDEFERVEGRWRFRFRDYSLFDLRGDLSEHVPGVASH